MIETEGARPSPAAPETLSARGVYLVECHDAAGRLKWLETVPNIVPTAGKNFLLDAVLSGSGYTAAWYMSLATASAATAASTYATPSGVTEVGTGVIANRVAMTWTAAASGSKSAATTTFPITGTSTITGNLVVAGGTGVATVGNTSATGGVLLSSGAFSTAKSVSSGDTLSVTFSLSV